MARARDDFTADTRKRLASRAGYRCSHPNCRVLTIGPSRESTADYASVGVAAHISAAAEGGPRWRVEMSEGERSSIENGIWLCQTHARLIDVDNTRFTIEALRDMKLKHEQYIEQCIGSEEVRPARTLLDGTPISDAAARILSARDARWFHALFTQLLRDEIQSARPAARALRYRVTTQRPVLISADAVVTEIRIYLHELSSLAHALSELVSGPAMQDALAPPGIESDPDALAWVARSIGDVYRASIAAGSRWLRTKCDELSAMQKLIDAAPPLVDDLVRVVEETPARFDAASEEAIGRVQAGEADVVVTVAASIGLPGLDELMEAMSAAKRAQEDGEESDDNDQTNDPDDDRDDHSDDHQDDHPDDYEDDHQDDEQDG